MRLALVATTLGFGCISTMAHAALDLDALWDFRDPARSEQRFQDALAKADGDDALILRTQIARTHGLRRDFDRARTVLREIERAFDPEAVRRVRELWELAGSTVDIMTPERG